MSDKRLKYFLYFTHPDIKTLLLEPKSRRKVLDYFAPLKLTKAYFECVDMKELPGMKDICADFETRGIETAGALLPAHKGPLCYNDVGQMDMLEKRVVDMARLFDEIITDDWLFTNCACEKCVAGRGAKNWAEYRPGLLAAQSAKRIIAPARKVNPKIKLIVKFPNWYEGHDWNGYGHALQIAQFDEFCTGIETRLHETQHQHIPFYSAYFLRKWLALLDPKKNGSVWYDNWEMKGRDGDYLAQVYQGILGGADEIVIWSAGHHYPSGPWSSVYPALKKELPAFEAMAQICAGHKALGVDYYMPHGGNGDEGPYMLPGYLGMCGIPLNPVSEFPSAEGTCFLADNASKDPGLAEKIVKRLREGKDLVMTYGLYQRLKNTEVGNFLQVVDASGSMASKDFGPHGKSKKKISFPKLLLSTWPYTRQAVLRREDGDFAVLMQFKYLNGKVTILNLPENTFDLFRLPEGVLNAIRASLLPGLGITLEGSAKVALYAYAPGLWVLYNLSREKAKVTLKFASGGKEKSFHNAITRKKIQTKKAGEGRSVAVELKAFESIAIK